MALRTEVSLSTASDRPSSTAIVLAGSRSFGRSNGDASARSRDGDPVGRAAKPGGTMDAETQTPFSSTIFAASGGANRGGE